MRYYKGHIALSEARDLPVLLQVRNARAICFDQLCELLSLEILPELPRSLRWRLARLEKAGLVSRFSGYSHLAKPVFGITQQGLISLESRGHYLLSLPSTTEVILHPSQVPHALEMTNIRIALARAGVLRSWKSDLEITSKNLISESGAGKDFDAVAEIEVDGSSQTIGIEVRAEPKKPRPDTRQFERFSMSDQTDRCHFVSDVERRHLLSARHGIACATPQAGWLAALGADAFRRSLLETRIVGRTQVNSEVKLMRAFLSNTVYPSSPGRCLPAHCRPIDILLRSHSRPIDLLCRPFEPESRVSK